MTAFLQNLLYCSAFMSVLTLCYIAMNFFFGSKHSARQRYYTFLIILIGFLTPIKIKPFGSAFTVVTYESIGNDPLDGGGGLNIWKLLFLVWFVGFLVCVTRDIIKHSEFSAAAERLSGDVTNPEILSVNDKVKSDRGIEKEVKLKKFPLSASPMIVGLFSPTLFLPHEEYSSEQAFLILSHEYVHLKRRDGLYKIFIQLLKAVHWFNPIVRLVIAKAIERECELSCDEEVSKNLSSDMKRRYCDVILESAKSKSEVKTVFSTNFSSGVNVLKKRFKVILSSNIKKRIMISGIIIAVLTMISGAFIEFSVIDDGAAHAVFETTVTMTDYAYQAEESEFNEFGHRIPTTMPNIPEYEPENANNENETITSTAVIYP